MVKGYILTDSDGVEKLLVVRTEDVALLRTLLNEMAGLNNPTLSELGKRLEGELDE